jgi:hypothetical protein
MAKWLYKLLSAVPPEERRGLRIDPAASWEVVGKIDLSQFIRALSSLVPDGSILYLEDGSPPSHLKTFLKAHSVPQVSRVEMGTIWPRPLIYHLPISAPLLNELADFADNCAGPEVCIHLCVYKGAEMLVSGYDFGSIPFYVSKRIPSDKLRAFCERLGLTYKEATPSKA